LPIRERDLTRCRYQREAIGEHLATAMQHKASQGDATRADLQKRACGALPVALRAYLTFIGFFIVGAGQCQVTPAPPPAGPKSLTADAVFRPGVPPVLVTRNSGGEFEILPAGAITVRLAAWPSSVTGTPSVVVSVDGVPLEYASGDGRAGSSIQP
jgi:hypothetical protein